MTVTDTRPSTGRKIVILALVAIVTSTVLVLLQGLIFGRTFPGVTGGVVGAITAVYAVSLFGKPRRSPHGGP